MTALPAPFCDWFASRGWSPHAYQMELIARADQGGADLLIAPTGGGKTLAGFLPSLIDLAATPRKGLHTLYISPLRALAADIRRNLEVPVAEMALPIRVEDRTGDTKQSARQRQRTDPPHMLLTTPESLALLLSYPDAPRIFGSLSAVIVDEAHAMAGTKRGDQLALCLSRLRTLAPDHRRVGLSATTEDPDALARWLAPDGCRVLTAPPGPRPDIRILETAGEPPWAGDGGRYAAAAVMAEIKQAGTTLVFINTRALAELFFQALWAVNDEALPIGLHHGSLGREARERVEAAMAAGALKAVVCTSSLDLGIDWGAVDLVIQVGAPKGVKRLVQRIGRANHQFDVPSRALLVPGNRFELIECRCALDAVRDGQLDGEPMPPGRVDVLCQHILLTACAGPFTADALYAEVLTAGHYQDLSRRDFDRCLDFCATGGYALRAYDKWQRLVERDGQWHLRDPRIDRRLRMNIGTIVEAEKLGVRSGGPRSYGGRKLGEVEEDFAATLRPGDTFLIGGEVVRYEAIREMTVRVTKAVGKDPLIPAFSGARLAISTFLAYRVIDFMNDRERWKTLPDSISGWLQYQTEISTLPRIGELLIETFRRNDRWYMTAFGFAGKNAHYTLGMILTKRMEEAGQAPLGYVVTDYAVMVWGLEEVTDPAPLFDPQGLRDGLDRWIMESLVTKRAFRQAATVAGLIERRLPGQQKTGRQATFSSDILYDTLIKYDPDHLMIEATRTEAKTGMVDFDRIEDMLVRANGTVRHIRAPHVTPLSAPLLMEAGRLPVIGEAAERLLEEEAAALMAESAGALPALRDPAES
ncbi:MAG: ligase-associated DNA damage response DEXH box helicase [Pseudomonadota bacterium]